MWRRMQASEELPASARELEPAVGQRPKHKRRGRVVTVLALGGVVALVTKEDLRSRLLDAVFGPEEQFEYDSVTEPVAPGIELEGAAMFPQSAAEVPTADAGAQDNELWSEPSAAAEPTEAVGDDAPAPSDHTPVSAYDPPARADDTPAPAEDAPASAYDAPAPAYDTPDPIETAKTPASGTPEPPHEAPAFAYPVYEAPPVASDAPTPNPVFDTPAPASEKGATAAHEAPAHGTPPRETPADETPADETPADQSPPAESRPAAETNTEPVASAEPSASAPELDSDPQPASSDGSPSFSSSESAAGAGFQLTAEAPPGGPLERPTVPVFESIPAPSDVPAQPASEAEGEEPALGDAAPRPSGWWLPWRRDAAPEPPRWDWRND
jgi:hypothetical protein